MRAARPYRSAIVRQAFPLDCRNSCWLPMRTAPKRVHPLTSIFLDPRLRRSAWKAGVDRGGRRAALPDSTRSRPIALFHPETPLTRPLDDASAPMRARQVARLLGRGGARRGAVRRDGGSRGARGRGLVQVRRDARCGGVRRGRGRRPARARCGGVGPDRRRWRETAEFGRSARSKRKAFSDDQALCRKRRTRRTREALENSEFGSFAPSKCPGRVQRPGMAGECGRMAGGFLHRGPHPARRRPKAKPACAARRAAGAALRGAGVGAAGRGRSASGRGGRRGDSGFRCLRLMHREPPPPGSGCFGSRLPALRRRLPAPAAHAPCRPAPRPARRHRRRDRRLCLKYGFKYSFKAGCHRPPACFRPVVRYRVDLAARYAKPAGSCRDGRETPQKSYPGARIPSVPQHRPMPDRC